MYIKTYSGALVNFDKLSKVDITVADITVAGSESTLRGFFDDYRAITLFVGTYEQCEIAMANLEEALSTNAVSISYYATKDDKNE